jgi:hypothetical protein
MMFNHKLNAYLCAGYRLVLLNEVAGKLLAVLEDIAGRQVTIQEK